MPSGKFYIRAILNLEAFLTENYEVVKPMVGD